MTKTLASTQSGLTASVTAEAHVETIATTLLTSISLRAARTPASAFVWSSSWKSWMGRALIQRERLARVLLNEQDAEPARVDLANAVEHEALERGRESRRRLVEEEQTRLHHQGHRHREHLSLAARERSGPGAPALGEHGEEVDDGPGPLVRCSGSRPGADREVLRDAERREHVRLLGHVAEAARDDAPGAGARDVGAAQRDAAGARANEPGQRLQQRRLPGAVRPDDGDQLTVVDAKRETMQDVAVAIAGRKLVHLEERGHRAVPR